MLTVAVYFSVQLTPTSPLTSHTRQVLSYTEYYNLWPFYTYTRRCTSKNVLLLCSFFPSLFFIILLDMFSHFIHLFGEVRCCCLYVTRPYYRTTPPGHVTVLLHVSAVNIADIFIGMNTQRKNKNFSTLVFYREAANEGNYGHCSHDLWLKEEVRSSV